MYKLKNKAENLDILKKIFQNNKTITIPSYFYFNLKNLKKNEEKIIKKIFLFNKKCTVIIRSASIDEDKLNLSNAGKYESKIVKKNTSYYEIKKILILFIKQFKSNKDKIIVQKMISNVDYSGVIFTRDINHNSPYYVINYDDTGKTNLITSGAENQRIRSLVIYKNNIKVKNKFKKLFTHLEKIQKKTKLERLDIEFAQKKNTIFLFQIRKLPKQKFQSKLNLNYNFNGALTNIEKKIKKLTSKNPTLIGNKSVFSNMSDWNPAEMIGDKPYPLSVSIYKELITDDVWRKQRLIYGYKDVFPNPLMFTFAGSPYIDLRVDFISFLPKNLSNFHSNVIVNKYLDKIQKNPEIHDKIEFNLIETCYSFNSKKRLEKIFKGKLLKNYLSSLKTLTENIFKNKLLLKDKEKLNLFENRLNLVSKQKINPIQKIYYLSEITKNYGTLPFAGLARCAFISQRLLLDLRSNKLINDEEFENFFSSIPSVTNIFNNDYIDLKNKKITKSQFIKKYGHLRPSTYDINSYNYREGFNQYFSKFNKKNKKKGKKISFSKRRIINNLLKKELKITYEQFKNFITDSIYLREYSKLIFTKGVNMILETLIELGKEIKISRNELSFIDFKKILNFHSNLESIKLKKTLQDEIKKNKYEFEMAKLIKLPDVILNEKNIYEFYENLNKPNFITLNSVIGETCEVKSRNVNKIKDKIVLIKNADPGYDFIFNHEIKGLVTQFGGANSHMAIRCLEQNIPAVIGVGKIRYQEIIKSKQLIINCEKKHIKLIK